MIAKSHYIKACTEAWLNCESLLVNLSQHKTSFSQRTMQVIDECAHVCFGTIQALEEHWSTLNQVALLCVGICEECAEVCERYNLEAFDNCAVTCRECSTFLTQLASTSI